MLILNLIITQLSILVIFPNLEYFTRIFFANALYINIFWQQNSNHITSYYEYIRNIRLVILKIYSLWISIFKNETDSKIYYIYINVYFQKNINLNINIAYSREKQSTIYQCNLVATSNKLSASLWTSKLNRFLRTPVPISHLHQLTNSITWLPSKIHHFSSSLALDASL